MRSPLARAKGLPVVRISPRMPLDVLEAIVALHRELAHDAAERMATPEEARRANAQLRDEMRERDNYFGALEEQAAALLKRCGHVGGPLSRSTSSVRSRRTSASRCTTWGTCRTPPAR